MAGYIQDKVSRIASFGLFLMLPYPLEVSGRVIPSLEQILLVGFLNESTQVVQDAL